MYRNDPPVRRHPADAGAEELSADLMVRVLELQATADAALAEQAVVLGQLHAEGLTDIVDGMRTGPWLAREAVMPSALARSRVKVSAALHSRLRVLQEALIEGRIRVGACAGDRRGGEPADP